MRRTGWRRNQRRAPTSSVKESDGSYLRMVDGEEMATAAGTGKADEGSIGTAQAAQGEAGAGAGTYVIWDELTGAAAPAPDAAFRSRAEGVQARAVGLVRRLNGVACRTAFDHLADAVRAVHAGAAPAEITRPRPGRGRDVSPREYAEAQPAGIRMGQGMQRVWHSHSPFRTVATLAMPWPGYIGVAGGGASHAGGTASIQLGRRRHTARRSTSSDWADTGEKKANLVKPPPSTSRSSPSSPIRWTSCGSRTRTS